MAGDLRRFEMMIYCVRKNLVYKHFPVKSTLFQRPFEGRSGYLAAASLAVQSATHSPLR